MYLIIVSNKILFNSHLKKFFCKRFYFLMPSMVSHPRPTHNQSNELLHNALVLKPGILPKNKSSRGNLRKNTEISPGSGVAALETPCLERI